MPSFIDLYRVSHLRDPDEPGADDRNRVDRAWLGAALAPGLPRTMLAWTEPSTTFETGCVVCGRQGAPIAVYGHVSVVMIAGSATPPPPTIVFCDRCAQDHQLGPGVSLAEELINAWRNASGLPERDLSQLETNAH
jgi:hypothetical protein